MPLIMLTYAPIFIRQIENSSAIDRKKFAQKWILSQRRARRRGHVGNARNIVPRNWNILIFVGRLEHAVRLRAHHWDLSCGWDRF